VNEVVLTYIVALVALLRNTQLVKFMLLHHLGVAEVKSFSRHLFYRKPIGVYEYLQFSFVYSKY